MSGKDFDWNDNEAIVLEPRLGLAVYLNQQGDVVIRQQGDYPDEDVWVVFPASDAETVARRIVGIVREAEAWARTATQEQGSPPSNRAAAPELPLAPGQSTSRSDASLINGAS